MTQQKAKEKAIYTVIESLHEITENSQNIDDKRLSLLILNALTQFSHSSNTLKGELNCEIADLQYAAGIDDEKEAEITFHKNTLKVEY